MSDNVKYEGATPLPEYLIKSIAEQGYSLETSLADLIDNSITAGANQVEILIDTDNVPFTLFLADNGNGMSEEQLKKCMQFPSTSLEFARDNTDLGRFGLGMKTASFAQTRCFTVISRESGKTRFAARTWDVDYLRTVKEWRILVNNEHESSQLLHKYRKLSSAFFNSFPDYQPNTVIVWQGLYKFEDYLDGLNRTESLKHQITETTTEYLSLVFHRFMEKANNPLKIRVNNTLIIPFNPFRADQSDLRLIESKQKSFKTDVIKLEGYVLPIRCIDESKDAGNIWTTKSKGLMDMEGMYVYRADRIIIFGGWNGIIRKSPRLQLARLKVEVGNKVDNLLHLNVAKSQISIPYDLRIGFLKYISELKTEAEKEYFNRGLRIISSKKSDEVPLLFERKASNKGMLIELNPKFPLIRVLMNGMGNDAEKAFKVLIKIINTSINKLRHVHEDATFNSDVLQTDDGKALFETIKHLLNNGTSKEIIKLTILPSLGYRVDTIPETVTQLLK